MKHVRAMHSLVYKMMTNMPRRLHPVLVLRRSFFGFMTVVLFTACDKVTSPEEPPFEQNLPSDFPQVPVPSDNPMSNAKVELGRYLFYDKRLSRDFSLSCASCHLQASAFSDQGHAISRGVGGQVTKRNAPTLANVAYLPYFFGEGGVPTLEQQALAPIIASNEMDMNTDTLLARLQGVNKYRTLFSQAWGDGNLTIERVTKSLAAFERTLVSAESAFDHWNRGDKNAISASAQRGAELFFGEKGDCWHCHGGFNFTNNAFHNTGLDSARIGDEGRYRITNNPADFGKFKTPTLRNIALTAPYMHDGRFNTLEEVVRHYNSGGKAHPNADVLMRPLHLTETEMQDLIALLNALTDENFISKQSLSDPW